MKYINPELAKIRKWQKYAILYRKACYEERTKMDNNLHKFLDTLGVPRSSYGYEDVTDGSFARIDHYIRYLEGKEPLVLKLK